MCTHTKSILGRRERCQLHAVLFAFFLFGNDDEDILQNWPLYSVLHHNDYPVQPASIANRSIADRFDAPDDQ